MQRWQRYVITSATALVVVFAVFLVGFAVGRQSDSIFITGGGTRGIDLIEDAYERITAGAVDPPSDEVLARGAIRGMVEALRKSEDPYAFFYTPEGYRSFQELTSGQFTGIGVWLKVKEGDLVVVSVLPRTPALEAGLKRGDVISAINGSEVVELDTDEAVAKIKGPEGSEVDLEVRRGSRELDFSITRTAIELPTLQARLTEDDLGYIRLLSFSKNAGKQVRREVEDLTQRGAKGLILDLRDNGGGLFEEAIKVASVFIEDGDIVTYRERDTEDVSYEAEGDAFEKLPVVVLVNEGTASASEIVAGALQDQERGVVVGTTTYGKGSVQQIVPLPDDSALKLTIAAYLTPQGRNINGKGIEPDVEVAARRAQLRRAKKILRGIVVSSTG